MVAVTSDGEVFGWGRLICMGLSTGEASTHPISSAPRKLNVGSETRAIGASCGWEGTLIWDEEGKLWAAGKDRIHKKEEEWTKGFVQVKNIKGRVAQADFVGKNKVVVLNDKKELWA